MSEAQLEKLRVAVGASPVSYRRSWEKIGHCLFMHDLRYGSAMSRNAISTIYYYPDEVGIG